MLLKNTIKRVWPWLYFKLYPSLAVLHAVTEACKKVGEPEKVDSDTFKKKVGLDAIRESWEIFYKKYFKIKIDLSHVQLPPIPTEEGELSTFPVIVVPGLTIKKIIEVMNSKILKHGIFGGFTIVASDDLKNYTMVNEREASTEPYAILFYSTNRGIGFNSGLELQCLDYMYQDTKLLYAQMIPFATLMEQLLFELKYNVDRLRYLDHHSPGTMCLGTKIQARDNKGVLRDYTPIIFKKTEGEELMKQKTHTVIGMYCYDTTYEYGIFKIVV